jgi:hypothetical protein
LNNLLV